MNKLEFIDYLLASGFFTEVSYNDEYILKNDIYKIAFFWDKIYITSRVDDNVAHSFKSTGVYDMPFLNFAMLLHALDVVNFETNLSKLVNKSYV